VFGRRPVSRPSDEFPILVQHPQYLISLAQSAGADTLAAQESLANAVAAPDVKALYIYAFDAAEKAAEALVQRHLRLLRADGMLYDEIEWMVRAAKADWLRASNESVARAAKTIEEAKARAGDLRSRAVSAKGQIDALLDQVESPSYSSPRMRLRADGFRDRIDQAIDQLLDDDVPGAVAAVESLQSEMQSLEERRSKAMQAVSRATLLLRQISDLSSSFDPEIARMEEMLISARAMADGEEFDSAIGIAGAIKPLAMQHLPEKMRAPWPYLCPICFGAQCPECAMRVDSGNQRCHLACECGAGYHICCLSVQRNFPCSYCARTLNRGEQVSAAG
jgi:hypothetical protein